jgi:hypothetical protein
LDLKPHKQGSEVKKSDNNLQPRGKSFSGVDDKAIINCLADLDDKAMFNCRVDIDDKAIINCRADLNRLVPFKYTWATESTLPGGSVTYSRFGPFGMFAQQDSARVDIVDPIDETIKP